MDFFNQTNVPDTITDRQWTDLNRRAQKAAPPMFSDKAIQQRKASNAQRSQAQNS
ncbi:hypothetical protein [Micromonospora sp. CPCC 206061]|uniref:hypothetical protein n=1 Tax=Micromonospora sp. CPCC 206061 TaxID=3122410 RepID=UPI002FF09007